MNIHLRNFVICFFLGFFGTLLLVKCVAHAGEWSMATGDNANVPKAYIELCKQDAYVCNSVSLKKSIDISKDNSTRIYLINYIVNSSIVYTGDDVQYGVDEKWVDTPASNRGDCEDYAITKKRMLLNAGFPASALLITLIYGRQIVAGKDMPWGHAVLVVVTSEGDYVLDNYTNEIYAWQDTTYPFYSRQSQTQQDKFVKIVAPTDAEE